MTDHPELTDPIADERDDAVLTEALLGEFGAERPDPDEFAAGVRSRIEQPRAVPKPLPGYLRAAAALLPPFLLPKPLTAGVGGVIAGKGVAKLLPGIAAFPVGVLVVLVVTMFVSLRALFRPVAGTGAEVDRKLADQELAEWWWRHAFAAVAVFVGLFVLMIFARVEAVALILVASTLALLAIWARLAAAGFATREEIGRRASAVLLIVGINSFGLSMQLREHQEGVFWITPLLLASAFVCLCLGNAEKRQRNAVVAMGITVVVISGLFAGAMATVGKVPVTVDDVRMRVEAADRAEPWRRLQDLTRCIRHLRGAGEPLPDLAALRDAVHVFRDARLATMEHDFDDLAVIELGFARESDWRYWRTANGYRERRVLEGGTPSSSLDYRAVYVLAHEGRLDDARRAAIAAQIVAENGARLDLDGFDDLVDEIVLLEALGRGADVAGMRDRALRLLRDRWVMTEDGRMGAFTAHRRSEEDAPGRRVDRLSFIALDSTSRAVELIARFGVPAGIDLVALGRYLQEQRLRYAFVGIEANPADAACALRRLETLPVYSAALVADSGRPLLSVLLDWRVFAAAVLLSAFAIAATWRARPANMPA